MKISHVVKSWGSALAGELAQVLFVRPADQTWKIGSTAVRVTPGDLVEEGHGVGPQPSQI